MPHVCAKHVAGPFHAADEPIVPTLPALRDEIYVPATTERLNSSANSSCGGGNGDLMQI
jgi:hypothetical protein